MRILEGLFFAFGAPLYNHTNLVSKGVFQYHLPLLFPEINRIIVSLTLGVLLAVFDSKSIGESIFSLMCHCFFLVSSLCFFSFLADCKDAFLIYKRTNRLIFPVFALQLAKILTLSFHIIFF